jgi:CO/xanthine dehydrogenase Mo-binding subunit
MPQLSVVGKSITRVDVLEKVTGRAAFWSDTKLPGMIHMKVLRSPYPNAKIRSIDTSQAKRLSRVRCVMTDKDSPQLLWGRSIIKDKPVLARDRVRYVGEPVAAVGADTIEAAEEAVGLIRVEYEELPAIFDPEEAMGTAPAVIIHPEFPKYDNSMNSAQREPDRPNVFFHYKIRKGNVEEGFKEADLILENRFSTPAIQHCALEHHGVVVRPEADGGLTIFTGRQDLWAARGRVAEIYGIDASKVRLIQPYVGGSFGGKTIDMELIPALLALKTGQPVRWIFTREEEFIDGGHREATVIYIKDGVKKDGTLVAREIKGIVAAGAYSGNVMIIAKNMSFGAVGTYRIPNLKWDSYAVYTNESTACAYRGFGVTESVWAIESHMDILAEALKIDPVELRKKNILKEGEPNAMGEITHSIGAEECLAEASQSIKLDEKSTSQEPWKKGKGIALGSKYSTAPTVSGARIEVTESGGIVLYHGADELGQGVNTVICQIVAEEFGIFPHDVKVIFSDTLLTPFHAEGSTSSRVTYMLGNAVLLACKNAKRVLFERAAGRLGVSPNEMETREKQVYVKANPDKKIKIRELFIRSRGKDPSVHGGAAKGGEIIGSGTYSQDAAHNDPETGQIDPGLTKQGKRINSFYAHIAQAVEVAVNIETGQVKVLRCSSAIDLGKAINPKACEQQSEGGTAMGISDTLYEEMLMERGTVINPNFTDYRIASTGEMPLLENMKSIFVESTPHKDGPYGAKGFGEGAMIAIQPAIANAIHDAVGVRIKDLPITPEKILKALKEALVGKSVA